MLEICSVKVRLRSPKWVILLYILYQKSCSKWALKQEFSPCFSHYVFSNVILWVTVGRREKSQKNAVLAFYHTFHYQNWSHLHTVPRTCVQNTQNYNVFRHCWVLPFLGVKNNLGHFKVKICTKLLFLLFFNSNSVLKISSPKNGFHARIFGFTYINLYKLTNFDQFW